MTKEAIRQAINKSKHSTSMYFSFFFLISTIFLFIAVKPNILTIITLQKEYENLTKQNEFYTKITKEIYQNQSILNDHRKSLFLIDESLVTYDQIGETLKDIENLLNEKNITNYNIKTHSIPLSTASADILFPKTIKSDTISNIVPFTIEINAEINDEQKIE